MDPNQFYQSLNVVNAIRDVLDASLYTPLPDNWHVVVADIRGSTDAIRLGKYKEVNMAGASIIAALSNAYGREYRFPFMFGGDGSMMMLPDYGIEKVKRILAFCKQAIRDAYGLRIDIGVIPVHEIRARGHDIGVARLRLSEYMDQAVFWGSGCTFAETLAKEKDLMEGIEPLEADFSGLECRWENVPSRHDEVAAYIIQAQGTDDQEIARIYNECFNQIEQIYGIEEDFHPIYGDAMSMTTKLRFLGVEWRLRIQPPTWSRKLKFICRMAFQYVAGLYLMKFGKQTTETDWGAYKTDIIKHADYKKFGDGLCFVATGTIGQRFQLTSYLDQKFGERKLVYGVHPSFAAMITCYVKEYQKNHIHFVDSVDGGYAKASQELKARKARLNLK